jgi:hypothetical protein
LPFTLKNLALVDGTCVSVVAELLRRLDASNAEET